MVLRPRISPSPTIEINPGFRRALDIMEGTDRHVFITGKAGTGKSTLLELFRSQTPKRKSHIWMDWRIVRFLTRFQYKKAEEALPAADKLTLVLEAIRAGGELEIVYLKPDDTKSRRRIRPEAVEMMEYHGKTFEGVRAYCHKRGECRTFRLDMMLEVTEV